MLTGIYSSKHEEQLIDSMRLRRLVTLLIAVGTLTIRASVNAWWRTLKGHVFGEESNIPPLSSSGGYL